MKIRRGPRFDYRADHTTVPHVVEMEWSLWGKGYEIDLDWGPRYPGEAFAIGSFLEAWRFIGDGIAVSLRLDLGRWFFYGIFLTSPEP